MAMVVRRSLFGLTLLTLVVGASCAGAPSETPSAISSAATAPASVSATSSPSPEPGSASPSPSQPASAAQDSLPPSPTDVTATSKGPGKPGTTFKVYLTWTQAAPTDSYRIYKYDTGEGPGYGKCVFDKAMVGLLMETQPGAMSADVSLDSAVTGAGVRCLYVVALNPAGESAPTLAWRSESG